MWEETGHDWRSLLENDELSHENIESNIFENLLRYS